MSPDRTHDWHMIQVTPLTAMEGGLLPGGETKTHVGCFACNMGYDEGKDVNCPGQDLFEEAPHDPSTGKPSGRHYTIGD